MSELAKDRPRWLRVMSMPTPPPVPPEDNPIEQALREYHELRENYASVRDLAMAAQDLNREMAHQIEAQDATIRNEREWMGAEIRRLQAQVEMLAAYGTEMRTRLDVIGESIMVAKAESLKFGAKARADADAQHHDDPAARHIADGVHEGTNGTRPPVNQF
jgi:hypothetical protein